MRMVMHSNEWSCMMVINRVWIGVWITLTEWRVRFAVVGAPLELSGCDVGVGGQIRKN
jgi:hypothetical protein